MSISANSQHFVQRAGLVAGPLAALSFLAFGGENMPPDARAVLAVAILMAFWWVSEAIPLGASSLLPMILLPVFTSLPFASVSAPYASNIIYLFMGGMMLGLGLERSGLHRRIALRMLVMVGASPRRLVAAFMAVTALFSMWLSNSATTMMLAPIGLSVIQGMREEGREDTAFAAALMLGIAYAASIGGMGTPMGTPTNLVMTGFIKTRYGIDIGMLEWMRMAVPVLLLLLPLAWVWLCFGAMRVSAVELPGGRQLLRARLAALGPLRAAEWRAGLVFGAVALCWISRPLLASSLGLPGLDDGVIALAGAIVLFLVPDGAARGGRLMDWETARSLPWDILLLLGGGLSLAAAISATNADAPLSAWLGGNAIPVGFALLFALSALIVFSGELTSNVAAAAAIMPVLAALCATRGLEPLPVFMVAVLSASCGFMLPVATPPNAIAYSSGHVRMPQMIRAGLGLNLLGITVIVSWIGWTVA